MRLSDGEVLDAAISLLEDHSWRTHMPDTSREHVAELVAVLMPLYQRKPPKQKPVAKGTQTERRGSEGRARRLVSARSGGLCEVCCIAPAKEWHHRKNRSQGGRWDPTNGLHLCSWDHQFITDHPEQAQRNGWTVRSFEDPAAVPVLRRGVLVLLDDEGFWSEVEGSAA